MREQHYLWNSSHNVNFSPFEVQDTQPLPTIPPRSLSLRQLRQFCHMTQFEVAHAAGVRLCFVDYMERGRHRDRADLSRVMRVFSLRLGYHLSLQDIRL